MADIYWGRVEDPEQSPVAEIMAGWIPYIATMPIMAPPPDPLHVTLFYDVEADLEYQEWFELHRTGQKWNVSSPGLLLGPEGLAAVVLLTPDQKTSYKMGGDTAPHISLALTRGHMAKQFGPMVKRGNQVADWEETNVAGVFKSKQAPDFTYFKGPSCTEVVLEHQQLTRWHGAEDVNDPEAEKHLADLTPSFWVSHQADVGCLPIPPVTFKLDNSTPVCLRQYPIKEEALTGIRDTITGLL